MCSLLVFASCKKDEPIDEAKAIGKSTADFPQIAADVFKPMDGGIDLSPEEIMGRNTWNLWSGGNEHFWNHVAQDSFGLMDLLKMLDNRKFPRGERFKVLGLVNEPGFRAASKPDEFGLWLDDQAEPEHQVSIQEFTVSLRVFSVFDSFRIRISRRKHARNGMAIVSLTMPLTTTITASSVRIASV